MKPFRERNLVTIGLIGFVAIALLMLAAFRADRLPIIGAGDTYKAQFAEIGGLKEGNEVRVAGVAVGNVGGIELKGDHVDVTFKLDKGTELGRDTGAAIKVRTLLGAEFLALMPVGLRRAEEGCRRSRSHAPCRRTTWWRRSPTSAPPPTQLDIDEVSKALDALAKIAARTPKEFRGAIKGVSDLSANLAARDQQINTLLVNLKKVSAVLNATGPDLERLFKDATVLFDAISARRAAVHRLLVSTTAISRELRALVKDVQVRPQAGPARSWRPSPTCCAGTRRASTRPCASSPGFCPRAGQLAGRRPVVGRLHQGGRRLMNFFSRFAGLTKVLTVFVVLALVAAVVLVFSRNDLERTVTVDFTEHELAVQGLGRPRPRRARRQGQEAEGEGRSRPGDTHVLARRPASGRREGRHHLPGHRGRPFRAAGAGLLRRRRCCPTTPSSASTALPSRSSSTRSSSPWTTCRSRSDPRERTRTAPSRA